MAGQQSLIRSVYSRRGIITYEIDVWHDELARRRTIKGNDANFVERMAAVQLKDWQEQWIRKQATLSRINQAKVRKETATERTGESSRLFESLRNTLSYSLNESSVIDWMQLKDRSPFSEPRPAEPIAPPQPEPTSIPREPLQTDDQYQPQLSLLDKLFVARGEQKLAAASALYKWDHCRWQEERRAILTSNSIKQKAHEQKIRIDREAYELKVRTWEVERTNFLQKQKEQNAAVENQQQQYAQGSPDAVVGYCDMVLANSNYPDFFPKEHDIDYNAETHTLLVDYSLPAPEAIPTLVEVRYILARDEFVEKHLSATQSAKLYDDLVYQIVLRAIHELFEADVINALAAVIFNGYVRSIDKGTGHEINACILSLHAKRDEFSAINLANIDSKTCFKQLKGIGNAKLHSVTPVAPIMRIVRDDSRFVLPYNVTNQLDEGYNLAAMDWEDFEHLIREVFDKEFSSNGGEVKVTQASRDGGVDAVAFDADPIRGGKIVIQAKRYTNIVGVAAVRDLYGTVVNEGATKGILVTTSDYGPDAYKFAKNKPLTLLNGANLLHLLGKHGHNAKIDLNEAKKKNIEGNTHHIARQ